MRMSCSWRAVLETRKEGQTKRGYEFPDTDQIAPVENRLAINDAWVF